MPPKALSEYSQRLEKEIKEQLQEVLNKDPTLRPDTAILQITQEMLKNNPYVPPKGCPVNDLPPELLAYIFRVGVKMEADGDVTNDDEEWEDMEDGEGFDLQDGWSSDEDSERMEMPGSFSAKNFARTKMSDDASMSDVIRATRETEEDEEEESSELVLPFQVLVSHVCKRWRQVAIDSPILWTALEFSEPAPFEKSRIWIKRAKESPLDIHIDATTDSEESEPFLPGQESNLDREHVSIRPEAHGHVYAEEHSGCRHPPPRMTIQDLECIFDLIMPVVSQWRSLEIACSVYDYMHVALRRLSQSPGAPNLEMLELYHYEDTEDYDTFAPKTLSTKFSILNDCAPKLKDVALWGVHLDWDNSISLLSGIRDLEFAYHAKDVRPSFASFSQIIQQSPQIRTLTLCLSGPAEHDDIENDWGSESLEIASLQDLVLCYHDVRYAISLVKKLSVPNLRSLALDYDDEDCTELVKTLIAPAPGKSKSLLAGLEHLKIAGLPCNIKTIEAMFGQLNGLKTINMNCSTDEVEKFFEVLVKSAARTENTVYLPNLQTLTTTGIDGSRMRSFVEDRRAAGLPLKRVMMSEDDDVEEKDERWLKANLDDLEYFEPSDSEEEFYEDGADEDDVTDME